MIFCAFGALAGHRCGSDLNEGVAVVGRHVDSLVFEDLLGLLGGLSVPLGDSCCVNLRVDQLLGLIEELTRDDDGGGGTVANFVFLGLADLDDHVRGGVVDIHLFEDGDTVVGDDDRAAGVDEHLVHALRTKGGAYRLGDRLPGGDVHRLGVFSGGALAVLRKDDHRLVTHPLLLRHSHCWIVCDSI